MENVFGAPNCSELDADEDFLTSQGITLTIFAAAAAAVGAALSKRKRAFSRGGSRPGKKSNRDIGRDDGAKRIDRDYFCRRSENLGLTPVFTEAEFERRYRIPRDVYERLREGLMEWNENYFTERPDYCGKNSASTDQKLWSAMRQLAYGIPADAVTEYGRFSESTNMECLKTFCRAVVELFESHWLRLPTVQDMSEIENHYRKLGFPGCLGCLDCASWQWDS
jgi:hypothetical protein